MSIIILIMQSESRRWHSGFFSSSAFWFRLRIIL